MWNQVRSRLAGLSALLKTKTPPEMVVYQTAQLQRIIQHAYHKVPYYRQLFDQHSIEPQRIKTIADLALIPITTRKTVQSQPVKQIIAQGLNPTHLLAVTTGGSSGIPLTIYRTWLEERLLNQFRWRTFSVYGWQASDKICEVRFLYNTQGENQQIQNFIQRLNYYQRVAINCFLPVDQIIAQLGQHRPDIIGGLPMVMERVAQAVLAQDCAITPPKFIVAGGEVMTQQMQQTISNAFKAPVFNIYGSNEFNMLAWQCPQSANFHVCEDNVIIEILKEGKPVAVGESGEMIVTGLNSFSMPFIRYHLGDLVTKGEACGSCGLPYATIRQVVGRMLDYLVLADGREVHPITLIPLIRDVTWIKGYRLIQETVDHLSFNVIPTHKPTIEQENTFKEQICTILQAPMRIDLYYVDELTLEKSGKFRIFQSRVRSVYREVTTS